MCLAKYVNFSADRFGECIINVISEHRCALKEKLDRKLQVSCRAMCVSAK